MANPVYPPSDSITLASLQMFMNTKRSGLGRILTDPSSRPNARSASESNHWRLPSRRRGLHPARPRRPALLRSGSRAGTGRRAAREIETVLDLVHTGAKDARSPSGPPSELWLSTLHRRRQPAPPYDRSAPAPCLSRLKVWPGSSLLRCHAFARPCHSLCLTPEAETHITPAPRP